MHTLGDSGCAFYTGPLSSTSFVPVSWGHSDVLLRSPLAQPPFLLTRRDDDDINDVASMAGVNLSEESARILATNSELVGTLTRSCKDETFLLPAPLQRRILEIGASPRRAVGPCPHAGLLGTVTSVLGVKLPLPAAPTVVCPCRTFPGAMAMAARGPAAALSLCRAAQRGEGGV